MINRKKLKFYALLALSLLFINIIFTIDKPFSSFSYYNFDERSKLLKDSLRVNGKNPNIYFKLANRNDILLLSDEKEIISLLLNTINNNPLHAFALLNLANIVYESGARELSEQLVRQAIQFSNLSADRLWEISFIAYKLEMFDLFYESLNTITKIDNIRRKHVYKLALKLIEDKEDILRYVIHESAYIHYFRYVIRNTKDIENSKTIYRYFNNNGIQLDKETNFKYINFLIRMGQSIEVAQIWYDQYGDNNQLVWNGGFEDEIINDGLGWRIRDKYDYNSETITDFESLNPLSGKRSLKIKFLDKNVDYKNVRQTVLVKPNTSYLFSALVTTENITSSSGVGWVIKCISGGALYKKTEYLTGNNVKKILQSKFMTPEDCNFLEIYLRRKKSKTFDKYISGEVIIDDIIIMEAE